MIIRRMLIANRGEIAVRIIRTCRRLGIETVLAVSDVDTESVAARLADTTVRLGPATSYLDVAAVVGAATGTRADAIHPGYGFLSENRELARSCAAAGIVFVGPTEQQLAAAGDKLAARDHALAAGLPVLPGGPIDDPEQATEIAERIGYPLLIKAAGGGGGRGMQRVAGRAELDDAVRLAMAEAGAAFGDPRLYLERFVVTGRHVEVQLLGDGRSVIHLGTRDCSVQRRYQKLVEEAPAPHLDGMLRAKIHRAAVRFGERLRYRGAGTVEFLVDAARREFYFLEMNARIQVEHPVTEVISGVDLIAEQIAIAEGHRLRLTQNEIALSGHAVECRINAEDWTRGFRPQPGTVRAAEWPAGPGIRVDTHVQAGAAVPPHYDSLVGKLIVHAPDRAAALVRLRNALGGCRIDGLPTTVDLHRRLAGDPEFAAGAVDTAWFPAFLARQAERRSGHG